MNQKQIGTILIIFAVLIGIFTGVAKQREDAAINALIASTGSCYLQDGTCLHSDRSYTIYIFGIALALTALLFGIYLIFFDKTQQILSEYQLKLSEALKEAKKLEKEKDEFNAFLSAFSENEQKILKTVKEQEGIKQSTLRYKTGLSKTTLSLILKDLEEKDVISRKPSGKTNKVYLVKKF